jgi:hypothetical protein
LTLHYYFLLMCILFSSFFRGKHQNQGITTLKMTKIKSFYRSIIPLNC